MRLLEVQALDSRLAQLDHRRTNLPEHAELERLGADLAQQRDLLVAAQTQESDAAREQTKAEQDVDQVRQRAARDQKRLDSGAVTSPKDLENLQHEIASLARRQANLEDIVLEIMERREAAQERVAELGERVDALRAKTAEAETRRDDALREIDDESMRIAREREAVAAAVPADLMALYDKLRAQFGGKMHQQRVERTNLDGGMAGGDMTGFLAQHRHTFIQREQRRLGRVDGHPDHQMVDQLHRPADDVQMAQRDRIESARIKADQPARAHESPPSSAMRSTDTTRSPSSTLKMVTPPAERP